MIINNWPMTPIHTPSETGKQGEERKGRKDGWKEGWMDGGKEEGTRHLLAFTHIDLYVMIQADGPEIYFLNNKSSSRSQE